MSEAAATEQTPAVPPEGCSVWIVWGSEKQPPQRYDFDTPQELNAFMMGADEASGWLAYEQFDTEAEAEAAFAAHDDYDSAELLCPSPRPPAGGETNETPAL